MMLAKFNDPKGIGPRDALIAAAMGTESRGAHRSPKEWEEGEVRGEEQQN